jgi:hypothetical protein
MKVLSGARDGGGDGEGGRCLLLRKEGMACLSLKGGREGGREGGKLSGRKEGRRKT